MAKELSLGTVQAERALALFRGGATLPFIARYRKEATGGLDEIQLRDVRDRMAYLVELEDRKSVVLSSIRQQGRLTPALDVAIRMAETKRDLEDLYLPFRPKRRTRASIATDRGLEPLADLIWAGVADDAAVRRKALDFVAPSLDVPDADAALQGARDILAERVAEDAGLRRQVREWIRRSGFVVSRVARGKVDDPAAARFRDYFDYKERVRTIPSHRVLAIRRGEASGALKWTIEGPDASILEATMRVTVGQRAARATVQAVARDASVRVLTPSVASEVATELKEEADAEAIRVFGENMEQLLLQPPAGERAVLGLDPGFRTGVKAAMVSPTGGVVATDTLYLHQPERFVTTLQSLVELHEPELIAVGNGTASRETEQAVRQALETIAGGRADSERAGPSVVLVNEAGASVYSASELAREELPGLDVSLRGAVSIARRLQDPLAELVKIDPRSIGVGQYQHDVHQPSLRVRLAETVELCVNRVGVDLNTASPSLLAYVAGIGPTLARAIVDHRERNGKLRSRKELLQVPRLGPMAFEQSAGFLRIRNGSHPLDATAVHPERYPLVERMARDLGRSIDDLVENDPAVRELENRLDLYASEDIGRPTLVDILEELRRPGRDPRDSFAPLEYREDVREPADLKPGMRLAGVVTNVVAFGAFVDVGIHQDGLVHISQLADRFVKDPGEVVRVGQRVEVTVLTVDLERSRIALSMKET